MGTKLFLILITGCVAMALPASDDREVKGDRQLIMLEIQHLPREINKRDTSEDDDLKPAEVRQVPVTRAAPEGIQSQYAQVYQPSDVYDLHQARLRASLAGSNQAYQGGDTSSLQEQSALNAQRAAATFGQSYRQNSGQIRQLQPTYAETSAEQPAAEQPESPQAAVQSLYQAYQPSTRLDPSSQRSLQQYQQQAQIAENAALAFQQAIQQGSKSGQRPRLQPTQYFLEHQHSYVVPDEKAAPAEAPASIPTEQYNLAALQQAYQQIETAQQKAVEDIQNTPRQRQRRPQRPIAQEDSAGVNIGDGDGFQFARQPGAGRQRSRPRQQQPIPVAAPSYEPVQAYQPEEQVVAVQKPVRTRQRQRVQQQVLVEQPLEQPVEQPEVRPVQIQRTRPQQIQYVAAPTPTSEVQYTHSTQPEYTRTAPEVQYSRQPAPEQYARIPVAASPTYPSPTPVTASDYTRTAPEYTRTAPAPVPEYTRPAPAAVPEYTRTAPAPVPQYVKAAPSAIPEYTRSPAIEYTRTAPTPSPVPEYTRTVQAAAPESIRTLATPATTLEQTRTDAKTPIATPTKIGNIDINLLRSLFAAAQSLAITQKDEIKPVTEDDLIKALLAQGRREQEAADIIQNAAKAAPPAPTDKEIDVVRIPRPKNQRPITQDELEALIQAGYDVRPVGEPTVVGGNAPADDPIRQQYLRQADFLEKQSKLRSLRQQSGSRRTRSQASQETIKKE